MNAIRVRSVCMCITWLVAALILSGCAATLPNKDFRLIELQTLEFAMEGDGRPCVIFESGLGSDMDTWVKVYPEVAKFTRVFAYNRPGYGLSLPRMGANYGTRIVAELHQLLQETGCPPPYVLVGHSFGGMFINLFARTYPSEVAGVIFVDSSHPDQGELSFQTVAPRVVLSLLQLHSRLSPSLYEYYDIDKVSRDVKDAGPFPDVPVRVLSSVNHGRLFSDSSEAQWLRYQKDLAAISPQGKQIVSEHSGHFIQDESPQLVIDAIREVVEASSTGHNDHGCVKACRSGRE